MRDYYECPKCNHNPCKYKTNPSGYDEMICPKCYNIFDPLEVWEKEQDERLSWNTFRDL